MSKCALTYEIPNKHNMYLAEILKPFESLKLKWTVSFDEIYRVEDGEIGNAPLFNKYSLDTDELICIVNSCSYYMIFLTLRAYDLDGKVERYDYYDEFMESDSKLAISVSDCSYVMIWSKDENLLHSCHEKAKANDYEKIEFIDSEYLIKKGVTIE